jgi:L-glyceraldehyde 3-phosphate reductase
MLKSIAENHGITLAQLALAWILQHREISSVIIGSSKPEQIDENVKAVGVKLDNDTMKEINGILNG